MYIYIYIYIYVLKLHVGETFTVQGQEQISEKCGVVEEMRVQKQKIPSGSLYKDSQREPLYSLLT